MLFLNYNAAHDIEIYACLPINVQPLDTEIKHARQC
jgi:hypothetical protein